MSERPSQSPQPEESTKQPFTAAVPSECVRKPRDTIPPTRGWTTNWCDTAVSGGLIRDAAPAGDLEDVYHDGDTEAITTHPVHMIADQGHNNESCRYTTGFFALDDNGDLVTVSCNEPIEGDREWRGNSVGQPIITEEDHVGGVPLPVGDLCFVSGYKTPPWVEGHMFARKVLREAIS